MASGLTDRLNCRLVESRLHPWIGYRTTSRELRSLLREQAASLRQTVVAAARSNLEASRQTQSEIEARMLATARMLVELDRHHVLNQDTLDEIVRENSLFRVTVYGSDREQQLASASDVGQRRGFGPGFAFGFGGDLFDLLLGGILAVVALLATFVPSWRAPRVDPMTNAAENE